MCARDDTGQPQRPGSGGSGEAAGPGRLARAFNLLSLAGGVILLVVTLRRVGLVRLGELAERVGAVAPLLVGLYFVVMACEAGAQHLFMRPEQRTLHFARLYVAHMAGVAINSLTPGDKLGEVTKVTLLLGHAPRPRVVAAVLRYNLVNLGLSLTVSVVGAALAPLLFDLPDAVRRGLLVASAISIALAVAIFVLVRRGLLASFLAAGRGLHLLSEATRARLVARLAQVDERLRHGRGPGSGVVAGTALVVLARTLYWTELYLILRAMGDTPSLAFMVVVTAMNVVLHTVASIVPMGIGVTEGGLYGLFALLGADPDRGIAASLVRRARVVIVAALGLLAMVGLQIADRLGRARAKARVLARHDDREPARYDG